MRGCGRVYTIYSETIHSSDNTLVKEGDSMRRVSPHKAGKMLVPMLGVLAVLSMVVAGAAAYVLMQERDKRQAKERELQLSLAENEDLKSRLAELQQAKSRIEEDLGKARKELTQSQQELAKAVEAQETLSRSVEDREREIGRLTKDLEQTRTEQKQVSSQLSDLQTERDAIKRQLADLEKAKSDLETKVMELSNRPTVELDKVVVGSDGSSAGAAAGGATALPVSTSASAKPDAHVVVINREYDFVVMNLGKNHGVSIGQEFQIVRGEKVLGKVKVEKVYDELSAAALLPGAQKEDIRDGDNGDAVRAL